MNVKENQIEACNQMAVEVITLAAVDELRRSVCQFWISLISDVCLKGKFAP